MYLVLQYTQYCSTAVSRGAESNSLHIGKLDEHTTKTGISTTKKIFERKDGIWWLCSKVYTVCYQVGF